MEQQDCSSNVTNRSINRRPYSTTAERDQRYKNVVSSFEIRENVTRLDIAVTSQRHSLLLHAIHTAARRLLLIFQPPALHCTALHFCWYSNHLHCTALHFCWYSNHLHCTALHFCWYSSHLHCTALHFCWYSNHLHCTALHFSSKFHVLLYNTFFSHWHI